MSERRKDGAKQQKMNQYETLKKGSVEKRLKFFHFCCVA